MTDRLSGPVARNSHAALEFFYEALAERRREPFFGDGVRLLSVHAAKGLEFPHVLLPGGYLGPGAGEGPGRAAALRRRHDAGARDFHLFERRSEPHPHLPALGGDSVERSRPVVERPGERTVGRRYQLLGLSDVYLGFAGMRASGDPIHARLAALRPGAALAARRVPDGVYLFVPSGGAVAALSKEGAGSLRERMEDIESMRVLAVLERFADDSEETFRSRFRCDRWEVPLVEVVLSSGGSAPVPGWQR